MNMNINNNYTVTVDKSLLKLNSKELLKFYKDRTNRLNPNYKLTK